MNGTIALRGVPDDFASWVALGCDEWGFESVLPWYRKLENDPEGGDFHGTSGPVRLSVPRRKAGSRCSGRSTTPAARRVFDDVRDHNLPDATGVGVWPRNRRDGNRVSTNMAYLLEIRDRPNLEIRHDTLVDRVLIENGRARGVALADGEELEARRGDAFGGRGGFAGDSAALGRGPAREA